MWKVNWMYNIEDLLAVGLCAVFNQLIIMCVGHIDVIQRIAYSTILEGKCCDLTQLDKYFNDQCQIFYYSGHEQNHDAMYFTFFKA
jgi:hypothetical protein